MGGEPLLAVLLLDGDADDQGARASHALGKWIQQLGTELLEGLLEVTVENAKAAGYVKDAEMRRVNGDTTVQEKNIKFPVDSQLYCTGISKLIQLCKCFNVPVRQSYVRVRGKTLLKANAYGRARQFKLMCREVKRLRTFLGRVVREARKNLASMPPAYQTAMEQLLPKPERLHAQDKYSKRKIYNLHSPEVECIGKGKPLKRYEVGVKTGVVATNEQGWVLGAMALHGNPYDGHSFAPCVEQSMRVSQVKATDAYVDRGYRGAVLHGVRVHWPCHRNASRGERMLLRRRSHLEATIGFMKNMGKLDRNRLHGPDGECGIARNISLLLDRMDGGCSFLARFCTRLL